MKLGDMVVVIGNEAPTLSLADHWEFLLGEVFRIEDSWIGEYQIDSEKLKSVGKNLWIPEANLRLSLASVQSFFPEIDEARASDRHQNKVRDDIFRKIFGPEPQVSKESAPSTSPPDWNDLLLFIDKSY